MRRLRRGVGQCVSAGIRKTREGGGDYTKTGELRGVSDTVGADYLRFVSWMLCMGCCMYNLEQNIPVEVRGCTAFACVTDGNAKDDRRTESRVLYGRNNDLPPYLRKGCKSEIYAPAGGSRFQITTSSFINGEEGLNEHGLAVAMTFVMTNLKKIRPGFNSCFIVRYLLEKEKEEEPDFETVWSSIFDLNSLDIYRAEGDPRRKKFIRDDRLCKMFGYS